MSTSFTVPCSVKLPEADGTRVKFNVDPGARGPRIIILGLTDSEAAAFDVGASYSMTLDKLADAPAELGAAEVAS